MKLSDLKSAPYNPREIDDSALAGLTTSLSEFGDLSGIVWNKKTGHLVCGHQRLDALKKKYGDDLKMRGQTIHANGDTFNVRVVDWPAKREKLANIAANNPHIAGTFTGDLEGIVAELKATDLSDLVGELRIDDLVAMPDGADGREFDESAADDVVMIKCPECGHEFPK